MKERLFRPIESMRVSLKADRDEIRHDIDGMRRDIAAQAETNAWAG